jgi:hypothetical protein
MSVTFTVASVRKQSPQPQAFLHSSWSDTFKGRTQTAFENWMLRNLFGPKREEVTRYRK